jgi:hypothetical protein
MPKINFTTQELQKFFSGHYFHKAYTATVDITNKLLVHADGLYPQKLVESRRPSESEAVKNYRKEIWVPITQDAIGRVITSLNKIRRSSDWSIKFDPTKQSPRIVPEETLPEYLERRFPHFSSLTNWAFNVLLKSYITDPNALVCVYPIQEEIAPNGYVRPFPFIYYSPQVVEYVEGDYAVVKSTEKVLNSSEQENIWGDVYYILTTNTVQRWEQTNVERGMRLAWEWQHNLGELPVTKMKGVVVKSMDGTFIYNSRIKDMLPRLDEAVREYSDLQAEVVQHIFSEKWEFAADECPTCRGKGTIKSAGFNGSEIKCHTCNGDGHKPRGPYTTLKIKPPMPGESPLPTPPIGYVQKNTEIVKIQDSRVDKHIYKALCAINFQFLEKVPQNESGLAKEVDKDELNTLVHAIAEDLVAILDFVAYHVNEQRYYVLLPDARVRRAQLPTINVPEKFDILSTNYLEQQLSTSKNNKLNPVIINAMEVEFANKVFSADSTIRDHVSLILSLDPLAGVSEEDKIIRLTNKGITHESYVISSNIQEFIARAIEEKGEEFYRMDAKDKKALMLQYAKEQIAATASIQVSIEEQE